MTACAAPLNAADFGAHQLGQIGIFLLRHGARSGGKGFGQNDKSELRGGKERDLFGKAAQVQADERERLQILENKIAIAGGIDGVGGRRGESELARGDGAVERKRCAGNRARAERAKIQPLRRNPRSAIASRSAIST